MPESLNGFRYPPPPSIIAMTPGALTPTIVTTKASGPSGIHTSPSAMSDPQQAARIVQDLQHSIARLSSIVVGDPAVSKHVFQGIQLPGIRGRVDPSSNLATATITLERAADARLFSAGDKIVASASDGTTGVVRAGSVTLTGVNLATGVLTASGNWSAGIAAIAASDHLFKFGEFGTAPGGDGWTGSVVRLAHRLSRLPVGWQATHVRGGCRGVALSELAVDANFLTLASTNAMFSADLEVW